jgi:hypothetical protein
MDKLNRKVDANKLEFSKQRTIDNVMTKINEKKSFWSIFRPIKFKFVMTALTVVLLIVVAIISNLNPSQITPTLSEVKTKKLVETSYISATIIANTAISATNTTPLSYVQLADNETEFEKNITDFNRYFNMLKAFIDEENFSDMAIIEEIEDMEYQYKISYSVDNKEYVIYISVDEKNEINGEITISGKTMTIEGKIEDKDDEFSLELVARKGEDFIVIEYESEFEDEIQKKYYIKQSINGIYIEKEVVVEIEDDETKVEIKEGNNSYKLEKYSENGVIIYYLEYEVNNLEGEVFITESIDQFGKTTYSYHIKESGIEKDIDLDDPDEDDEDDEDDDDNEDDEDEEDDLFLTNTEIIFEI